MFGSESCKALTLRFGGLGSALIYLFAMAIGAVVAMDQWVIALCSWTWNWTRERAMPAAVAVGTSAGAMALNAGSMAGKAAVGKAKEKTGGFWASFVGSLTRKPVQVREHDLDDADEVDEIEEATSRRGRGTKAGLKLGICGEHGGDPASIAFCEQAGLDYVSCSPYRVPIARLAAAQAALRAKSAH